MILFMALNNYRLILSALQCVAGSGAVVPEGASVGSPAPIVVHDEVGSEKQ